MIELLSEIIENKRVLILGYGREGRSTYKLISMIGSYSKFAIADVNPPDDIPECTIHSGDGYLDYIDDYDLVIKSPGVVLPQRHRESPEKITSQVELFLRFYNKQVIGVTGTKGKSTVSSLLYHVLSSNNIPCLFAGNIGRPVFEVIDDIKPETIIVLELSCHQLEICRYSPATAVYLNLYEDHLDYYDSFEAYARTKNNIYIHQCASDELYCGKDVKPQEGETAARVITVKKDSLPFKSFNEINCRGLLGDHNLGNCAFVYAIAKEHNITDANFISSLLSYVPLSHRLEFIGNKDSIDYYDDSISTTSESTISAIETISNASTVLIGGMDRGIDYRSLVDYLSVSKVSNVICMYESGRRIFDMLKCCRRLDPIIIYCNNLQEAVSAAQKITEPGKACLLSPASASYGDFKNFEERGNAFKKMVFG